MKINIVTRLFVFLLLMKAAAVNAQFGIVKGNSFIEFSGAIVTDYNYRFYPAAKTDHHKNGFTPDVMEFQLKGVYAKNFRYCLDVNFANLIPADTTRLDYYVDPALIREAYVSYSGLRRFADIKVGYMKLPFSRSSITEFAESPFLQRGEIARGDVFSRRDIGIQLDRELMNRRLFIRAGAYTGLGEGSMGGDNDASGKLLYVGRIDYSWPGRYRFSEYDLSVTPLPVFSVGVNGMYEEKESDAGVDYGIQTINGKKSGYGFNADAKFMGFTAHFEALQFRMVPNDTLRLLGKPTDYFLAGGIIASVNYYCKCLHSVFAVRYDELNPDDLTLHDTERTISFAYNYLISQENACVKIQYWYHLDNDLTHEPWTPNQLRVGFQLLF
ncbi:MAG TPA: porin [Bacteroidia bacterium]|nr:porin [Bacteroidia bacterium]